jgi:hypothetical protein
MLVTGGPPVRGDGGMPQRIIVSSGSGSDHHNAVVQRQSMRRRRPLVAVVVVVAVAVVCADVDPLRSVPGPHSAPAIILASVEEGSANADESEAMEAVMEEEGMVRHKCGTRKSAARNAAGDIGMAPKLLAPMCGATPIGCPTMPMECILPPPHMPNLAFGSVRSCCWLTGAISEMPVVRFSRRRALTGSLRQVTLRSSPREFSLY